MTKRPVSHFMIKFKKLDISATAPSKAYESDSGYDFHSLQEVFIHPMETKIIKTGIALELPMDHEMQIRPRSGVSVNTPLRVTLGTIDNTYCGEVGIIVQNVSDTLFVIPQGYKLAQGVLQRIPVTSIEEVSELSMTDRNSNGFGSTGV